MKVEWLSTKPKAETPFILGGVYTEMAETENPTPYILGRMQGVIGGDDQYYWTSAKGTLWLIRCDIEEELSRHIYHPNAKLVIEE